jgi:Ribbon-helix-helix protein, copG family.
MHVHNHDVAKTKRVQVLMDPAEFETLERLAKKRGTSVAELMRQAVRSHLLDQAAVARRRAAFRRFLELPQIPLPPWKELKAEIEARRG